MEPLDYETPVRRSQPVQCAVACPDIAIRLGKGSRETHGPIAFGNAEPHAAIALAVQGPYGKANDARNLVVREAGVE